jgi:hypothetical protein
MQYNGRNLGNIFDGAHIEYCQYSVFHESLILCKYYIIIKGKKIKFSLCLTKHQAMKAYWRSGGITPRIP